MSARSGASTAGDRAAPSTRPLVFHPRAAASTLERRLRAAVRGDVLFDAASRGRYATDASIYQVDPVGVLVPRSVDDVRAARELDLVWRPAAE